MDVNATIGAVLGLGDAVTDDAYAVSALREVCCPWRA